MLESELHDLVRRLLRARKTTLFVTHDPREAKTIADRLAILEASRITAAGTFEEVLAGGATPSSGALRTRWSKLAAWRRRSRPSRPPG
jgi:ABC-type multidrug transport system ATPase subunit